MIKELFDLSGKIALVTGASRGIGEDTAHMLAECGAHVIVSSRKIDGCHAVVEKIKQAGGKASAIACNTGDVQAIDALFEQIEKEFAQLDILINNAATNPTFGHILETDLAAVQKTVDVNIRGYFYASQKAGRMMKGNGGVIVNNASMAGLTPGPMMGIYSITKAAVINMTKAFANECGQFGIRVNAVAPGVTDTKFASVLVHTDEIREEFLSTAPIKRVGKPQEIAAVILFLACPASSYVTGATYVVDGGVTA